jgi:uncharacterized membrane protein (UPF0127 family)
MRAFLNALILLAALFLGGCASEPELAANERRVVLPGGQPVIAEVVSTPAGMAQGMMYRDSLPPGRGMLFLHDRRGRYPYWMFNCKIALDIIWMDSARRVVEISAATPPCEKPAAECPNYGGHEDAQFVLELASGEAARLGISRGGTLQF